MRESSVIHSQIGASSMYRWQPCPGSVRLSKGVKSTSSAFAAEGTAAHALLTVYLKDYLRHGLAARPIGEYVGSILTEKGDGADSFIPITDDMLEAVQECIDWAIRRYNPKAGDVMLVDHGFDLSSIHPGCFGTADLVIYEAKERRLIVADYKHGAGIPVEVADYKHGAGIPVEVAEFIDGELKINPQLQYYALGALVTTKFNPEKVTMVIVQPRCNHPDGPIRSHTIDAIDLLDFSVDLQDYAKATEDPKAPLHAGDWCRFCPARGICPELATRATEVVKMEFAPQLPYDPDILKKALDSRDIVKAWLKAVDEFGYQEAMAGRTPPTYKLVAKRANREYRNEGEVIEHLQAKGFKDDVIFEPRSLKSPAQLEKVVDKKIVADFVVSESSGYALVHESDKRPAVKAASVTEEFAPTE